MRQWLLGAAALMLTAQAPAPVPAETETADPTPAPAPRAAAPATKPIAQPTPMPQRVATIAVLNKNNSRTRNFAVRPGQAITFERLTVRVRACEATPPWDRPWSGAFVQVDDRPKRDAAAKRVFSGWLFAESPSINSFDHPVYDVWVKSCAMSFPETGPDTIVAGRRASPPPPASASSAKK